MRGSVYTSMQMAHLRSSGKVMLTKLVAGRIEKLFEGDT